MSESERLANESMPDSILLRVREGMDVLDADGERIGKVRELFFGTSSSSALSHGTGAVTTTGVDLDPARDDFVDILANALVGPERIPDTLRARLRREGFVQIDSAGLFAADRFAMPDQIRRVDDRVHLNVKRDDLIRVDAGLGGRL